MRNMPSVVSPTSGGANYATSTPTVVTGGSNPNVFGAYTQLIASTDYDSYGFIVYADGIMNVTPQLNFAIGAAGSEVNIAEIFGGLYLCLLGYPVPVFIPAGSRLSVRSANEAYTATSYVGVSLLRSNLKVPLSSYGRLNSYNVDGSLIRVDCGATANTKGAYTQIFSSTVKDGKGFSLYVSGANAGGDAHQLLDLAVGAAGSETIIFADIAVHTRAYASQGWTLGPIWTPIPAGSRIAMRGQCDFTTSGDRQPTVSLTIWE